MKRNVFIGMICVLMIAGTCALSYATSYTAADQFSLTANPNGVWSYGYGSVSGSASGGDLSLVSFTYYQDTTTTTDFSQWYIPGTDFSVPNVGYNYHDYDVYGVTPGHLTMHPGAEGVATILAFTAATSGYYTIDADFLAGDTGEMLLAIFLGLNSTALWTGTDSGSYDYTLYLDAGTTLYFVVYAPEGDTGYYSGNTGLDLTITTSDTSSVPEPASMLLFGIGILGLAGLRRKNSK